MMNSNTVDVDDGENNENVMDTSTMANDEGDNEDSVMHTTTVIRNATFVASSSTSTRG